MTKLETFDKQVKSEIGQIKKFLLLGVVLFVMALIAQVILAVIPFYFYWYWQGVENPLFGALSFGVVAVVVILGYTFRSFLFDFSQPEGVDLEDDSSLMTLINETAEAVNAPKPDKVFLTDDFNAYVSSYKTYKNPISKHYLSIGIQVLSAVSREELKCLIAHELGHLSKEHTFFSRFIYRVYHGLYEIDRVLRNSPGYIDYWFHKGLNIYLKKLDKLSYATLRSHEFHADEIAAQLTSNKTTASVLCRIEILSDWLEDTYWKHVWRNTWKTPIPEKNTIIRACKLLSGCSTEVMGKYLDVSKMRKTDTGDTHPCLKDRIEFLGQKIHAPEAINKDQLAIHLLGNQKQLILRNCEQFWLDHIFEEWQDYHYYMKDCVMRRDLLEKVRHERKLLFGEKVKYARLVGQTKGLKIKFQELIKLNKSEQGNDWVMMEMLDTLYKLRDHRVIKVANHLIKKGSLAKKHLALATLKGYFQRLGMENKVELVNQQLEKVKKMEGKRDDYKKEDLLMHDLSAKSVAEIEQWLKTVGNIDFAMICKVGVKAAMKNPLYLLYISTPCYLDQDMSNTIWSGITLKNDIHILDVECHWNTVDYLLKTIPKSRIFGSQHV